MNLGGDTGQPLTALVPWGWSPPRPACTRQDVPSAQAGETGCQADVEVTSSQAERRSWCLPGSGWPIPTAAGAQRGRCGRVGHPALRTCCCWSSDAFRPALLPLAKEVPTEEQREEPKESFLGRQMLAEELAREAGRAEAGLRIRDWNFSSSLSPSKQAGTQPPPAHGNPIISLMCNSSDSQCGRGHRPREAVPQRPSRQQGLCVLLPGTISCT